MVDLQTLNLEAAKLVKEWSAWMVAVQTGLIAFLTKGSSSLDSLQSCALVCFGISILAAAWVLSALPYIVICLPDEKEPNLYLMPLSSAPLLNRIPLWKMGMIQHLAFAFGLILLIAGTVL